MANTIALNDPKLTKTMIKAIDYIGRHRKTSVNPRLKSCGLSMRTANKLVYYHYAMWSYRDQGNLILTLKGERVFTALHPTSKWSIK